MSAERFTAGYDRGYEGPRIYECRRCGATYEHDQAYHHVLFDCDGMMPRKEPR